MRFSPSTRRTGGPPSHRRSRPRHGAAAAVLAAMGVTATLVGLGELSGAAYSGPTLAASAPAAVALTLPTARLSGADRYATAAAVSAATFPGGAPVAYLATGADYPDALAAAAAAGGRGPVLLGGAGGVPVVTVLELERLRPARVVIVGGTGALPATTETAVRAALPSAAVTRVQGPDRFVTAAALMVATFSQPTAVAYVATGAAFPDALTAAAAAAGRGPVLLVPPSGIPVPTEFALTKLQPRQIVVVGGTDAVPAATAAGLAALLPHAVITRVAGSDRYATAAAMSAAAFAGGASVAYLATGTDFPDALTAAAAAAGRGPVLLVRPDVAPTAVTAEVHRLRLSRMVLVGGNAAVGSAAVGEVLAAAGPPVTAAPIVLTTRVTSVPTTRAPPPPTTPRVTAPPVTAPRATVPPPTAAPRATVPPPTAAPRVTAPPVTAPPVTAPRVTAPPTTLPAPFVFPTTTTLATYPASPWPATTTTLVIAPPPPPLATASIAVATAEAQLGKPYVWAGAGPASFDCSGLTMFAWAAAGLSLPHNAAAQAAILPPVIPDVAHLAPGDLIFYDTPIDHVAIYVGGGMMVEAAHAGLPVRLVPIRTDNLVGAGRP